MYRSIQLKRQYQQQQQENESISPKNNEIDLTEESPFPSYRLKTECISYSSPKRNYDDLDDYISITREEKLEKTDTTSITYIPVFSSSSSSSPSYSSSSSLFSPFSPIKEQSRLPQLDTSDFYNLPQQMSPSSNDRNFMQEIDEDDHSEDLYTNILHEPYDMLDDEVEYYPFDNELECLDLLETMSAPIIPTIQTTDSHFSNKELKEDVNVMVSEVQYNQQLEKEIQYQATTNNNNDDIRHNNGLFKNIYQQILLLFRKKSQQQSPHEQEQNQLDQYLSTLSIDIQEDDLDDSTIIFALLGMFIFFCYCFYIK